MERFDKLFEKNSTENSGSFYVRSKIFFAKEHLMQDWPAELNVSKVVDEEPAEEAKTTEEEAKTAAASSSSEDKTASSSDPATENT